MYWETVDFLKFRGYEQYEISIMQRRDMNAAIILGIGCGHRISALGLGASSLIEENRFSNTERTWGIPDSERRVDSIRKNRGNTDCRRTDGGIHVPGSADDEGSI